MKTIFLIILIIGSDGIIKERYYQTPSYSVCQEAIKTAQYCPSLDNEYPRVLMTCVSSKGESPHEK